jgi:aquaporin Z
MRLNRMGNTMKKLAAEFFGTFWLVLGGCGSAVLAAAFPDVGIGLVGVSLAFGITVLTMAYAVGHISGGHFNPAVSVAAQCAGAIVAALVLYLIATGKAGVTTVGGFASNGYGESSPGKFSLFAALLTEVVMTAGFLIVILGATAKKAAAGFAPIAIGMALTLIHLVSIGQPRPFIGRGPVC